MDCKTCKEQRNVIPYIAHEAAEARHERRERRLLIALLIAVLLLFASNAMWLYYEGQFDTISYVQDGAGLNNINTGDQGDIYGTEAENTPEAQPEPGSRR